MSSAIFSININGLWQLGISKNSPTPQLIIFLRYSDILNFNNLKPYGISNFTASTLSDAFPHR